MGWKLPLCLALVILVLDTFVPIASGKSSWKYCSDKIDYKVTVQDVVVDPDPVIRGSAANFEIPAITSEVITGGEVIIDVYYLGVPVHRERDDLCEKTECPAGPGAFNLSNSQGLPGYTPTGSYRLDMKVLDEENSLLTCVKINFRIVKSALQVE